MHRPTRQHQNLVAKITLKKTRNQKKKPGRKAKRWSKWIAAYAPLTAGAASAAEATG
jgi:hypothetical protein